MSDYPRFFAKTSKGYAVVPQSNEEIKEGAMFALYYDEPTLDSSEYNIMSVHKSFANVFNPKVFDEFNSQEEAVLFLKKAEKVGFFDIRY